MMPRLLLFLPPPIKEELAEEPLLVHRLAVSPDGAGQWSSQLQKVGDELLDMNYTMFK